MRCALLAAVCFALAVAPARAAVSLGGAPDGLAALTVAHGVAYAVVGSGDPVAPFALVRSTGTSRSAPQRFGEPGAEFPDLATGPDESVVATWGRASSAGETYVVARAPAAAADGFGPQAVLASGTGPAHLALDPAGEPLLAFPDEKGDAALAGGQAPEVVLTAEGPDRRHLPLDIALDPAGQPFVLDLVQTRTSSELRLLGPGAPAAAAVSVPALRDVRATLAIEGSRAYVAYALSGRVRLASAALEPGGRWSRRRLPGRGGATGAPAVLRSGGRTLVAYTQRQQHGRGDVFLATETAGRLRVRRLTRTTADERAPLAAAGPAGDVFVGWSRGRALRGPATAVLARVR